MTTLYKIDTKLINGDMNVIENDISIEIWYKKLGHLSEKEL